MLAHQCWMRVCVISCLIPPHVSRHTVRVCARKKKNKNRANKGGWQLCKMESRSVKLNPEVPLTHFYFLFLPGKSYIGGYLCCRCVCGWACASVLMHGTGILWYKTYKKSCPKEGMFISFANRMSSFFPTESGNDVVLFVCVCVCVCRVVCFCLCKSVFWNEEPTASTQDVPVYITKLKCILCEVGWFNCEMPERFPFTGLTGEQPQVQTSCHRSRSSAGLRAASHRTGGDFFFI